MAEISILVPVYNVEKYLESCLDSILNQTFTDFEVICMDDGSTDRSGHILDEYAAKDIRIKVVHKKNSGYGNTMNRAVELAAGKYIGIVESDDTIAPDMYQILYDTIKKHDLDMVKSDFYLLWDKEDHTRKTKYYALSDNCAMYNRVIDPQEEPAAYLLEKFTWNALYKRELLIRNQIRYNETPGAAYQDNGFWFQTFYWARRVMVLDKPLYYYRQDNVMASSHNKKNLYDMKHEFDFIRAFMIQHGDRREMLYHICFHLRMKAYLFTLGRIDCSLKPVFAEDIERERAYFEETKEACYDWMTDRQISIIKNPVEYTENEMIGCRQITGEVISGYAHIIIYGAGAYGERAAYRVKAAKSEGQILQIAVTDLQGKSRECLGQQVCEIADCTGDRGNSLVILAVKEESEVFFDMLTCLKQLDFPNIISISAKKL